MEELYVLQPIGSDVTLSEVWWNFQVPCMWHWKAHMKMKFVSDAALLKLICSWFWKIPFFQSLRKMNKMYNQTRMHSSRMRTIRSSSHVYPSMHWAGCVYPSMHWVGGVCPGMYPSMHWGRHPTLWREWLTDRCKNITFPQLRLRR